MKIPVPLRLLALLLIAAPAALRADEPKPLPRSAPEAQGLSSPALQSLFVEVGRSIDSLHSMMIVRHGRVVAEGSWAPFASAEPHMLFSLSKSFTSSAIGIAQAEGRLSIDDPVLKFFPEDAPAEPSENLKAMRIRDLLTMTAGHHADAIADFPFEAKENLVRRFLALPVAHKPGTHFVYNTPASFILSAIVQKVSGTKTVDYLGPRLFAPLGIPAPAWEESADGISLGGFGLNLRLEEIARFGQLLLNRGEWGGRRLLPAEWVDLATSRQASNGSDPAGEWDQGYGFQFWRCTPGFYRADGAFGQFCIVMPQYDTVVAITAGTVDTAGLMRLLWARLLPELRPAALPANDAGVAALRQTLSALALPPQTGTAITEDLPKIAGRTYRLPVNPQGLETVALRPDGDGSVLTLRCNGAEFRIPCGHGTWSRGGTFPLQGVNQPTSASGGWTAPDTFTAQIWYHLTPFRTTLTLRFETDRVVLTRAINVGPAAKTPLELVGVAE